MGAQRGTQSIRGGFLEKEMSSLSPEGQVGAGQPKRVEGDVPEKRGRSRQPEPGTHALAGMLSVSEPPLPPRAASCGSPDKAQGLSQGQDSSSKSQQSRLWTWPTCFLKMVLSRPLSLPSSTHNPMAFIFPCRSSCSSLSPFHTPYLCKQATEQKPLMLLPAGVAGDGLWTLCSKIRHLGISDILS